MAGHALSRINQDHAESVIVSGADTVMANGSMVAYQGSITAKGNSIVTSTQSVYVEGKPIARESDLTNTGAAVLTGSQNICVGD